MFSALSTRRGFAAGLAAFIPGLSLAGTSLSATAGMQAASGAQKLDYDGKPAGTAFIPPLIVHHGVTGQGAHSHDPDGKFRWISRGTGKK